MRDQGHGQVVAHIQPIIKVKLNGVAGIHGIQTCSALMLDLAGIYAGWTFHVMTVMKLVWTSVATAA